MLILDLARLFSSLKVVEPEVFIPDLLVYDFHPEYWRPSLNVKLIDSVEKKHTPLTCISSTLDCVILSERALLIVSIQLDRERNAMDFHTGQRSPWRLVVMVDLSIAVEKKKGVEREYSE